MRLCAFSNVCKAHLHGARHARHLHCARRMPRPRHLPPLLPCAHAMPDHALPPEPLPRAFIKIDILHFHYPFYFFIVLLYKPLASALLAPVKHSCVRGRTGCPVEKGQEQGRDLAGTHKCKGWAVSDGESPVMRLQGTLSALSFSATCA